MFISSIVVTLLVIGMIKGEKEQQQEYGPFYLPEWDLPELPVSNNLYDVSYWEFPDKADALWVDIARWKCLSQGNRPFFTADQKYEMEHVLLTDDDFSKIKESGKCRIGQSSDKEIRGSDGEYLCGTKVQEVERNVLTSYKIPTKICPNLAYWSDRCYTSWSCVIKDMTLPIYAEHDLSEIKPVIYLANGTKLIIGPKKGPMVVQVDEGNLYIDTIKESPARQETQVPCFEGKTEIIICVFDKSTVLKFETVGGFARYNNRVFSLIRRRTKREANDPATQGDLGQINNRLQLLEESLNYYYLNEIMVVYNLRNQIEVMIKSLSKIDDELIGNLMKQNLKSEWVGNNLFYLKPKGPINLNSLPGENCIGKYRFIEGRWTDPVDRENVCQENATSGHPLNLFKGELQGPLEVVFSSNFRTTSSNYEGWKYIANYKTALNQISNMFHHDGSAKSGWASSVDGAISSLSGVVGGIGTSTIIGLCLILFILKKI